MKNTNPKGAGRPKKYNEESAHIQFKVPSSKSEHIVKVINRYLDKFRKK